MWRVVVVLTFAGCASQKASDQAWLEAREHPNSAPVAPPPRQESAVARNADALAARIKDDIACDQEARTVELDRDAEGAWALTRACARRGKWSNLRDFLRRHRGDMQRAEDIALLAQVVASRGGDFRADLPGVREAGWRLYALADVLGGAEVPPQPWTVFRARLGVEKGTEQGLRVIELAEERRGSEDINEYAVLHRPSTNSIAVLDLGRVGSQDFFEPTGVVVKGRFARGVAPPTGDVARIFLGRYVPATDGTDDITSR